jgi:hypothetical protein
MAGSLKNYEPILSRRNKRKLSEEIHGDTCTETSVKNERMEPPCLISSVRLASVRNPHVSMGATPLGVINAI